VQISTILWYVTRLVFGQESRQICEIAVLTGGLVDPPQRPSDESHFATMRRGGPRNRFETCDVRGEAGDRDSRFIAADEIDQRPAQIRLRAGGTGAQCICRVADHCQDAVVAEPAQRRFVRSRADQRVRIKLPITGMQHRPDRCVQCHRIGFGDRMSERD